MPRLSKIGAAALAAFGWTGLSTVSASYLVVAGGGGGGGKGGYAGGGGGAGGYLTGTATLNPTLSYTITVGAGASASSSSGTNGSNSTFNSVTAIGGGGAASTGGSASSGGSGGGGSYLNIAGAAGTSGQGNSGGTGNTNGFGSGGGGAGAAGANQTSSGPGAGGTGLASSISGTSTYYAGGGGGGGDGGGSPNVGAGGLGGGGSGSVSVAGVSGTANTGGGGGGTYTGNGGQGGSGIVIISYPAPQKFGGGIVTTSGSNVIHTFNTSGTLTPLSSLTASYLIVAGGGAGGCDRGGGGGAGGLLQGSGMVIDTNSIYLVTVGAGATGVANQSTIVSGSNSSFSLVSTVAIGGGGGAPSASINGASGGSGGGGNQANGTGGAGTSGQGNAGGAGGPLSSPYAGGGGGGAGTTGTAGNQSTGGGAGGAGLASSISGTSTYYAGGGGGGAYLISAGAGGNGGGGAGSNSGSGTSGTANTGGGGGGATAAVVAGGNGGSGVVIISYAGSTQQMAGGTVTISGGNVIHTFTSSGYLTPIKYVNNSLRFRSSASAYLNRTPASAGNRQKWTYSGWIKRGSLSTEQGIMHAYAGGSTQETSLEFQADATLRATDNIAGVSNNWNLVSNAVYRDPASWYHIVWAVDTTQATSSDRVKLYINGIQITSFSASTYPSQNFNTAINYDIAHYIGQRTSSAFYDGYMTEINLIDGQQLTPNSFGTFNSYGVWQPITYGGSYGTNGFYLPFTNKTSTTTLGYDFSPNGNNWTTNNISLTAGSTYDSMTDVPTLTSATAANWCVGNPLYVDGSGSATWTNGNLTWSCPNTGSGKSTLAVSTGKWYWELVYLTNAYLNGVSNATSVGRYTNGVMYESNGTKWINGTNTSYGATYTTGDVIGVALDMDGGTVTFYKNNTSQGSISLSGASITNATPTVGGGAGVVNTGNINFGQQPFVYTPPSGYVALNTYNL
jgi:hypothetical protein